MKKAICIILSVVFVLTMITACGSSSNETTTKATSGSSEQSGGSAGSEASGISGTSVVIAIPEDPDTLSPFISGQQGRDYVCQVFYQPVFDWDSSEGVLTPVIAESYEHTDSSHTVIKVRDNVHDSAGNAITASDVAFCIKSAADSGNYQELSIVKDAEATGDYEVTVTWGIDIKESLEGFQGAMNRVNVVNQEAYEASSDGFSTKPVATGPYVCTDVVSGSTYTFEADPNYWGKDIADLGPRSKTNVEKITFSVITEESQRSVGLETDVVDFSSIPSGDAYLFEEGGADAADFILDARTSVATTTLKFNCAEHINTLLFSSIGDSIESEDYTAVCSNANMRKAIAYAIDVDEIIQGTYGGRAIAVNSYGGSPLCSDYDPAWDSEDYYDVDIAKGKEYLAKALDELDMTADQVNIVLHCNTRDTTKTTATIIANDIEKLGIKCTIQTSDVRAETVDPTIWELELKDSICTSGYIPLTWTDAYGDISWENDEVQGKYNWCFVSDDKLEEYNVKGEQASYYSQDFIEEARQYVIYDQCYQLMLTNATEYYAADNSKFTKVVFGSNGVIIPQSSTYTWN